MTTSSEYILRHSTDFKELDMAQDSPIQLLSGGFMMCLRGSCDITIDMMHYHIKQWDMVVAFPYSVIRVQHISDDFDSIAIGVGIDFFVKIQIPDKGTYFTMIKEHPSIALDEREAAHILALRDMLTLRRERRDHPFSGDVEESILKIILYDVAAIYSQRKPNVELPRTRDEIIFNSFVVTLFNDYRRKRSLNYYAQLQSITAAHLSKVVKRVSGRTASQWLVECVVNGIKYSLQDRNASIADVADEYNFANPSFFAQYFKKHTGLSPREYRTIYLMER